MGGTLARRGVGAVHTVLWQRNPRKRDHFEDLSLEGRVILQQKFNKSLLSVDWIDLALYRCTLADTCECDYTRCCFIKYAEFPNQVRKFQLLKMVSAPWSWLVLVNYTNFGNQWYLMFLFVATTTSADLRKVTPRSLTETAVSASPSHILKMKAEIPFETLVNFYQITRRHHIKRVLQRLQWMMAEQYQYLKKPILLISLFIQTKLIQEAVGDLPISSSLPWWNYHL